MLGDPQKLDHGGPKCKCSKVSKTELQNKNSGTKLVGTVQKGHNGIKIGRDSWTLGDREPKCKCKKVSGTKTVKQKLVETLGSLRVPTNFCSTDLLALALGVL